MNTIDGLPLSSLEKQYREDLFEDFLPFMDKFIVDHELGGFMCAADRDGTRLNSDKDNWFDGRGIWVYSFLYRNFTHDPRHLEIARKTVDFVLSIRPKDGVLWPRRYTRHGEALAPDGEIYGTAFMAEGLAEYAAASGEDRYRDLAKEVLLECAEVYERPDYALNPSHYFGTDVPLLPGGRVQGAPMVLLRISTQLLRARADNDLEKIAAWAIDAIMTRHYNPSVALNYEFLNHDYTVPANEYSQFCYTGHTLEIMWMVMDEALRRGDKALFDTAAERFRRNVEVSWDDVYGGVYRGMSHLDRNEWFLQKVLWPQEEALIGSLMLFEHRRDPWAEEMFGRMYRFVQSKFPLRQYGFPLWINFADRKVSFERHYDRVENYHHPRHLMLNLLALKRMMEA